MQTNFILIFIKTYTNDVTLPLDLFRLIFGDHRSDKIYIDVNKEDFNKWTQLMKD